MRRFIIFFYLVYELQFTWVKLCKNWIFLIVFTTGKIFIFMKKKKNSSIIRILILNQSNFINRVFYQSCLELNVKEKNIILKDPHPHPHPNPHKTFFMHFRTGHWTVLPVGMCSTQFKCAWIKWIPFDPIQINRMHGPKNTMA